MERAREQRSEAEQERLNRQMIELLNELRVAMPGVQVLFGFLLAVPFQQRFAEVDDFQRGIYFATLLSAATATAFLIAPSAYHRIAFRQNAKPDIIRLGTRQFLCGLTAETSDVLSRRAHKIVFSRRRCGCRSWRGLHRPHRAIVRRELCFHRAQYRLHPSQCDLGLRDRLLRLLEPRHNIGADLVYLFHAPHPTCMRQ